MKDQIGHGLALINQIKRVFFTPSLSMREDYLFWQDNANPDLGPVVGVEYNENWRKLPTHDCSLFYRNKPERMHDLLHGDLAINMVTSVYVYFHKMDKSVRKIFYAILERRWLGRHYYIILKDGKELT